MEESRIAVLAALLGNLALAILKGVSAAVTGSAAMMAETFHSCADRFTRSATARTSTSGPSWWR